MAETAENKISGAEFKLSDIFSKRFEFEIPPYQRPYSWTTEEAGQLFDDLFDFHTTQLDSQNSEPYFLGSIVLVKNETEPYAEVIDGQQRLTTLTILLAVIVDKLISPRADGFAKYINEPGDEVEDREPKPRLTLRKRDSDFFKEFIQTRGKIQQLIAKDPASHNAVQVNIICNAKLFNEKLQDLGENAVFTFGRFIINHCYLVAVSTHSMRSAYRIFSVLNSRGLDLLPTDILKSDTIGKISDDDQDDYTKKWDDKEEALGRDPFSNVISHIRMIYRKAKLQKTVLDEFREFVLTKETNPKVLIDKVICPYADAYQTVTEASYECTGDAELTNAILRWMNRIDNADWVPPAMWFLKNYENTPDKVAKFIRHLERLAACMFICRFSVNERIERYAKLLEAMEASGDANLYDAHSPLMLTVLEKENTRDRLDGDIYNMNKRVRTYVLLRLDNWISDGAATYTHGRMSVEHVLPQTVADDSEWAKTWPDPEKRKLWVHRLGNLALLTRKINSSASNWDFETKKNKYFRGVNGSSSFAITTKILTEKVWIETVVTNRQKEMLGKLDLAWGLSL